MSSVVIMLTPQFIQFYSCPKWRCFKLHINTKIRSKDIKTFNNQLMFMYRWFETFIVATLEEFVKDKWQYVSCQHVRSWVQLPVQCRKPVRFLGFITSVKGLFFIFCCNILWKTVMIFRLLNLLLSVNLCTHLLCRLLQF